MKEDIVRQIREIAIKYRVERILLFGSRARGDHSSDSDYDIAVFGDNLSDIDRALFCADIEVINTLKKIDVVFIRENTDKLLVRSIQEEGVTIYE